jgi:hypothetical protein
MEKVVKVVIKANILADGKGCPVCGGNKTEKAMTCRPCISRIGRKATEAVKEVTEASLKARAGHEAAVASGGDDITRLILQPVILAQFKLPFRAKYVANVPAGIEPYFHVGMEIENGFCNVSVFGASQQDRGTIITGLVEVKRRKNDEFSVPYVRIQRVSPLIKSNVFLSIKNVETRDMFPRTILPITRIMGQIKGNGGFPKIIRGCVGYVIDTAVLAEQIEEDMVAETGTDK